MGPEPKPTPIKAASGLTVLPPSYPPEADPVLDVTVPIAVVLAVPGAARVAARETASSSARNAAIMAAGTTLSRISGFARVIAVIWVLGSSNLSDAYNLANTLPNIVYELLLGGVLSATLLPVVMQSLAKRALDKDDQDLSAIVTFLVVMLAVGTAIFWLAAPLLMHIYLSLSSGPSAAGKRALATSWLHYFAPQLLFIGLTAVSNALLNARRRFAAVAFSPILANVVTIGSLVAAGFIVKHASVANYRADTTAVAVVGLGTTAGYVLQFAVQLPALWRCHIHLRFVWRPSNPALRTIARLSGWTLGVVATNQLSYSVNAILANKGGSGQYSSYVYAYTFMQLPYAVVAVSIAYAVAPDLAGLWSRGATQEFAQRVGYALRYVVVLLLPGGVGYCLLARSVVSVVSAHGAETLAKATQTGSLLAIFALGLPGFSAYLLLMRAFQAKQDTRSMFMLYALENGLTVVLAVALYPVMGVQGLAVAWIGCYTFTLPLVWRKLRQSAPVQISLGWTSRLVLATGTMAIVVGALVLCVPSPHDLTLGLIRVVLLAMVGGGVFVVAARLFGIEELSGLRARLRSLAR